MDKNYAANAWIPIRTEADLPKEHGLYLVTTIPTADPFSGKPRTIAHRFDDVYKERFWMGSFSAWMPLPPRPEPYNPEEAK